MLDAKEFQIRKRDSQNRLVASGFEFYETVPVSVMYGCLAVFLLVIAFVSGAIVFANIMTGSVPQLTVVFAVVFVACVVAVWALNRKDPEALRIKRVIVFFADDRIIVSNRKAPEPKYIESSIKVSDVDKIHWRPSPAMDGSGQGAINYGLTRWLAWQVDFHLKDGQTVWMVFPITREEDARFISTQLNQALAELQYDQGHY